MTNPRMKTSCSSPIEIPEKDKREQGAILDKIERNSKIYGQ
jgi:hypothetical protein